MWKTSHRVIYVNANILGWGFSINHLHYFSAILQNWHALRNVEQGWRISSLSAYMGFTRSQLPQNNGNSPLPSFGGNYLNVLLDNIY